MDLELSHLSNFKDFLDKSSVHLFNIKEIEKISDVEHDYKKPVVFFYKGDLILYISKLFYVSKRDIYSDLKKFGDVIARDRKHFPLFIFYILSGNDENKFDILKKKFANKLFYYLDSPIDPFILKDWGIELDLTAVSYGTLSFLG